MVIISNPHVDTICSSELSEPVKDPDIHHITEKALSVSTCDSLLTRDEICKNAHITGIEQLATYLNVDLQHGLAVNEAAARLAKDGPNAIKDTERISVFQILLRQVSNSLSLVLFIVMVLSFILDDYIEGAVVAAVILLNIVVGFVQDYRAEQTILSLQALSSPECNVLRDSQIRVVKAETLVIGDVVRLSAGAIVPADLRLFDGMNLSTDEALLTGESLPISKCPDVTLHESNVPIGDRINMAYSASTVTCGRGIGVVVATGMQTEVGKIAGLLSQANPKLLTSSTLSSYLHRLHAAAKHALGLVGSPLQITLSKFALWLFAGAIILAIIVFSANLWDVDDEVLIYGICVAVAVIPESLIAVLTLTTAVGTKAMARSNIIIRRLSSLEAVGGVTNICSDKTGTLTQGKMIVKHATLADGQKLSVHGTANPFDPRSGSITIHTTPLGSSLDTNSNLLRLLDVAELCNLSQVQDTQSSANDGNLSDDSSQGSWTAIGEPTEIALRVFAMRFDRVKLGAMSKTGRDLITEFPFDSTIKRMSMAFSNAGSSEVEIFTKGATEALLPILNCSNEERAAINMEADHLASQGLRVLCLAYKQVTKHDPSQYSDRAIAEMNLTYVGLVGIYDPPRTETAEAVSTCKAAGIAVHMLTGDHIQTATAIAKEVGIIEPRVCSQNEGIVMAAADFDKLSDEQIDNLASLPLVLARCPPATKVRMVQALHRRKAYCIMTGDGINDSPALKLSDIGIAMGLNGSDVAKQAADMVLADDNFASIVLAIKEGRRLFDNIQKFLVHLLTSNVAQVVLLMIGLAFKDTHGVSIFPLSPLEILWANLVTSSPIALGLGLESASAGVMNRPPRSQKIGIFTKELIYDNLVYGVVKGVFCLACFAIVTYRSSGGPISGYECNSEYSDGCITVFRARSTTFAMFTFGLVVTAWEVMDFRASLFNTPHREIPDATSRMRKTFSIFPTIYHNRLLFFSCIAGVALLFPLIYVPALNTQVLKHSPITWEWVIVIGFTVCQVAIIEAWKMAKRRGWLNTLLGDETGASSESHEKSLKSSNSSVV